MKLNINKKIDMYLLSEAATGAKLTPYAKSALRLHPEWDGKELDNVVAAIAKNAGKFKYEVSFNKGKDKKLLVWRRGDDVIKRNMGKDELDAFKKEMDGVTKGTGWKVTDIAKSADWAAAVISK